MLFLCFSWATLTLKYVVVCFVSPKFMYFPNDFSRRVPKKNGRANEDYHQEFNPEIQETGETKTTKERVLYLKPFSKPNLNPNPILGTQRYFESNSGFKIFRASGEAILGTLKYFS